MRICQMMVNFMYLGEDECIGVIISDFIGGIEFGWSVDVCI